MAPVIAQSLQSPIEALPRFVYFARPSPRYIQQLINVRLVGSPGGTADSNSGTTVAITYVQHNSASALLFLRLLPARPDASVPTTTRLNPSSSPRSTFPVLAPATRCHPHTPTFVCPRNGRDGRRV